MKKYYVSPAVDSVSAWLCDNTPPSPIVKTSGFSDAPARSVIDLGKLYV